MQAGAPEGLVGIDVAYAGDERLIHQRGLEAAAAAPQVRAKDSQRECFVERLRAVVPEQLTLIIGTQDGAIRSSTVQTHTTELAHIAEEQPASTWMDRSAGHRVPGQA